MQEMSQLFSAICPKCGRESKADTKFCPYCGKKLKSSKINFMVSAAYRSAKAGAAPRNEKKTKECAAKNCRLFCRICNHWRSCRMDRDITLQRPGKIIGTPPGILQVTKRERFLPAQRFTLPITPP